MRCRRALLVGGAIAALAGCGKGASRNPITTGTGGGGGSGGSGPPGPLSGTWAACGKLGSGPPAALALAKQAPVEAILFGEGTIALQRTSDHSLLLAIDGPPATSLALSPDGHRVATAGPQGIRVWNAADGTAGATVEGAYDQILFAPDAAAMLARVASASSTASIELRDAKDGKLVHAWSPIATDVMALAFSADGTQVVLYQAGELRRYAATRTGEMLGRLAVGKGVASALLNRDGSRLAVVRDLVVDVTNAITRYVTGVYETNGGQELWSYSSVGSSPPPAMFMSNDGQYLYLASDGADLLAVPVDLGPDVGRAMVALLDRVPLLAASGAVLLLADDGGVYASTNPAAPEPRTRIPTLPGQGLTIAAAVFSRDGKWLATSWYALVNQTVPLGPQAGDVIVWDLATRDARQTFRAVQAGSLSFSADGQRLLATGISGDANVHEYPLFGGDPVERSGAEWLSTYASDERSILVNAPRGIGVIRPDGTSMESVILRNFAFPGLSLSPDKTLLATSGPALWRSPDLSAVWPTPTPLFVSPIPSSVPLDNWVTFSPDGQSILVSDFTSQTNPPWNTKSLFEGVTVRYSTSTRLYRAGDGTLIGDYGDMGRRPVFSPDGAWILAGDTLLNLATNATVKLPLTRSLPAVSTFAPDGRIAVGREDGVIQLFCPM